MNIKFNTAHYYEDEITGVLTLFEKLAREVASKPNQALCSLDLVDEKELKELTVLGQGENLDYDSSESIVTIFRNRVAQTPDSVGVVYKDKKYTYKEIDDISSRLSVHMAKNFGVGSGDIVSILIERSELMLIYPLAVLKLGAAYMPLDPKFPEDRLLFMCKDAGVKLVLTQGDMIKQHMSGFDGDAIYYESISEMDEVTSGDMKYLVNPSPDDRMIILFTSGSTGKPKAVELNHKGIVNIVHQYTSKYGLSTDDRVAAYANFGFDAHMTDLYPSIFAGAPIYILAEEIRMDLNLLNDYLEENKLTTAFFTTQIAYLMKDINHSLRLIQAGGEKLPPMSKPRCRFINAYGPTECSLYTTTCDVDKDFDGRSIGRPIPNSKVYIVGPNGRIVPRGIPGELLIGGVGVGRGYLNRPELTAEKFVEYIDGEKVYKTGDLVRWAKEGDIEFLGRLDSQVKLRGQRIEIGEIETRVNKFEAVSKAVVTVKSDKLCCYYTAKYDFDEQNLKNYLQEVLTNFMIPEIFIKLSEMPLTQNGKINIRDLPEAKFESAEIVLPDSDEEKVLFEIARTIIGHDGFGVTDQLQRVGMSSIAMMRFAVEADKHNIKLKVNDVMKYGSIRNILKNMNSVQYWYNKYDGKKPVAVVVQGVSTFVQVRSLIDILADKGYAVFIIDPIMNHLDKCKGKDKQALADGYVDIVRANIGHGNVDVFAGHSFGGELAYRCACRWNELTDSLAKVILLDSYIVDADMITEYIEPDEKTKEQMEYSKMADTLKACPIPDFGGEVILFRAMELNPALRNSINEERFKQISDDNLKAWMERVERLKVYDILADHFSMTDEKFKSQLSQKINSIMGQKYDVLWLKL